MRVVVVVEARLTRGPDGAVWTREGPAYRFFSRYLTAFDTVRVVARVAQVDRPPAGGNRVDGPAVEVWPLPYYVGPIRYLARRAAVARSVVASAEPGDAVILRVPSVVGLPLAFARERAGLPFALEVMGDPYDVFAPGSVRHVLRPLLRSRFTAALGRLCRTATAVAYVTDGALQARYPAASHAVTASYSSVDLPAEAYVPHPRTGTDIAEPPTLISVGTLEQMYKGIDTLFEAVALLTANGTSVRLVHAGDGRLLAWHARLAARLRIADRVAFTGPLSAGEPVRRRLDTADLFVMPSRTEGLPKALVEAMARGLPAVGSAVGGIPELLPADDLVPPGDPTALADAIGRFIADPVRLSAASVRNLARAHDFSAEALAIRRDAFYHEVADRSRLSGAFTGRSR